MFTTTHDSRYYATLTHSVQDNKTGQVKQSSKFLRITYLCISKLKFNWI